MGPELEVAIAAPIAAAPVLAAHEPVVASAEQVAEAQAAAALPLPSFPDSPTEATPALPLVSAVYPSLFSQGMGASPFAAIGMGAAGGPAIPAFAAWSRRTDMGMDIDADAVPCDWSPVAFGDEVEIADVDEGEDEDGEYSDDDGLYELVEVAVPAYTNMDDGDMVLDSPIGDDTMDVEQDSPRRPRPADDDMLVDDDVAPPYAGPTAEELAQQQAYFAQKEQEQVRAHALRQQEEEEARRAQ
jgi:hypothetical protein